MTEYNNIKFLLFFSCLILFFSCSKENSIVQKDIQFKNLNFNYNDNGLGEQFNNEAVKLGRVLFYDKELSLNSTVSCGSCHKQEFAFADNVAKSEGFLGGLTDRNTPNLINTKFNTSFFWDGRVRDFPTAVTTPIFDHKEMGMSQEGLIDRLSKLDYYDKLFSDAFGSDKISGPRISLALVEFVGSILSVDATIDRFQNKQISLSNSVRKGMDLFESHCNDCHDVLSNPSEDDRDNNDPYLGSSGRNKVDIGLSFQNNTLSILNRSVRIPSLRNVSSTAPYMHDGRFQTLLEVINHYNEDVISRRTIDSRLLDEFTRAPQQLDLSETEKEDLVSFLETLTDSSIEQLEKYSNPFIE